MSGADTAVCREKFSRLLSFLREAESAVLAFSGGVDSSFLLKTMKISGMKVLAVTADSETIPRRELIAAASFADENGVEHMVIRTEELSNKAFTDNPPDRCFFCKDGLFARMRAVMDEKAYRYVFDGSNAEDLSDYRPGRRAAALHGVKSPLADFGFSKHEIREVSRELGIDGWDRPASPCLSSRFPYGSRITRDALRRVEKAEEFLRTLGVQELRVRDYGDVARIEVDEEGMRLFLSPEMRRRVSETLKSFGYVFVSLDLDGYRTGSLNRSLKHLCGPHTPP